MAEIMMIDESGPREVLAESVWPGLVRYGRGAAAWQTIAARACDLSFELSDSGVWLPDLVSSEQDLTALQDHIHRQERIRKRPDDILPRTKILLGNAALTGRGCWVSIGAGDAQLRDVMEIDAGNRVIDPLSAFPSLRQCDTPDCLYPRHSNAMLGTPTGLRVPVYPNSAFFMDVGQHILTAWGNRLPTVQESRLGLQSLQRSCAPYANVSSSLLTLSGIGQFVFLPTTGCWMVQSYYMRPPGATQYDAYGRLTFPGAMVKKLDVIGSPSKLAHRVVWRVLNTTGQPGDTKHDLNHLCGFRPCANPGHLTRSTHLMNVRHGELMAITEAMMSGAVSIRDGLHALGARTKNHGIRRADQRLFWDSQPMA